jgi:hypothetical protein
VREFDQVIVQGQRGLGRALGVLLVDRPEDRDVTVGAVAQVRRHVAEVGEPEPSREPLEWSHRHRQVWVAGTRGNQPMGALEERPEGAVVMPLERR